MLDKFNVEKQNIYITTQGLCAVACIKHQTTMCYITMVNKRKTNTTCVVDTCRQLFIELDDSFFCVSRAVV